MDDLTPFGLRVWVDERVPRDVAFLVGPWPRPIITIDGGLVGVEQALPEVHAIKFGEIEKSPEGGVKKA